MRGPIALLVEGSAQPLKLLGDLFRCGAATEAEMACIRT